MQNSDGNMMFDSLGFDLNLTARAARALLDARLAEQGVTFATWVVLVALATRGPLIQRDLAQVVDVEGPTMVRRLDALEREGILTRVPDPDDRRATRIQLTSTGSAMFDRVRTAVADTEAEWTADFPPAEIAAVRSLLGRLANRARALRQSPNRR